MKINQELVLVEINSVEELFALMNVWGDVLVMGSKEMILLYYESIISENLNKKEIDQFQKIFQLIFKNYKMKIQFVNKGKLKGGGRIEGLTISVT